MTRLWRKGVDAGQRDRQRQRRDREGEAQRLHQLVPLETERLQKGARRDHRDAGRRGDQAGHHALNHATGGAHRQYPGDRHAGRSSARRQSARRIGDGAQLRGPRPS